MNQHKVSSLRQVSLPMPPSYEKVLHDDKLDYDGTPIGAPDPANIADTDSDKEPPNPADITYMDAFEELGQNNHFVVTSTPDQLAVDESPDTPDAPKELPNDMEVGDTDAMLIVVIDHFSLASASALIHGISHGNSIYESDRDLIWSPFISNAIGYLHVGPKYMAQHHQQ